MRIWLTLCALLIAASASAQPRPGAFTTLTTTSQAPTSICVGCPIGSTTPTAGSAITAAAVVLPPGVPGVTTNKLYSIAGSLFFNGVGLAAGSSVSGTTGKISKFTSPTSLSDSLLTEAGSTVTVAGTLAATSFSGPGAGLTGVALLGSANTFTATPQAVSGNTSSVPLVLFGSDGGVSGIVAQLVSASVGRASVIHFSDNASYNMAIGVDGVGNFNYWNARSPGVAGTSMLSVSTGGNLAIGGAVVTDAVGSPTVGGGWGGAGRAIAGKNYAFVVTIGSGGGTAGFATFSTPYPSAPICTASANSLSASSLNISTTTTAVEVDGNYTGGDKLYVLCRGY